MIRYIRKLFGIDYFTFNSIEPKNKTKSYRWWIKIRNCFKWLDPYPKYNKACQIEFVQDKSRHISPFEQISKYKHGTKS